SLRTGSIAAAAGSGLLLFVIIAGIPLMLPVVVLGTVVALATGRGLRHLWLLAPTVFLGWPWLWALVHEPGAVLTMPGQTLAPGRGRRQLGLLAPTVSLGWPWLWALAHEPGAVLTMPGQTLAPEPAPTYLLAVGFPGPIDMSWLADLAADIGLGSVPPGVLQLWAPVPVLPMLVLAFFTLIEARLELSRLVWAGGLYLSGLVLAA